MHNHQLISSIYLESTEFSQNDFEVDEEGSLRPVWIRLTNHKLKLIPRFLTITTPSLGENIYKRFGRYYLPLDYSHDEERIFMNEMADEYDQMVGDKFNIPMAMALWEKTSGFLKTGESNILDLGCGTGILSKIIFDSGFKNIKLIDFSERMLANAMKKFVKCSTIQSETVDVIKSKIHGNYDLVISVMLFNTFNEKETSIVIDNCIQGIKSKGIFAVLEDGPKIAYKKYFNELNSGYFFVADRKKYIFIGQKI